MIDCFSDIERAQFFAYEEYGKDATSTSTVFAAVPLRDVHFDLVSILFSETVLFGADKPTSWPAYAGVVLEALRMFGDLAVPQTALMQASLELRLHITNLRRVDTLVVDASVTFDVAADLLAIFKASSFSPTLRRLRLRHCTSRGRGG